MATIKEDYCSYEVARLFKEKGFNEVVHAYHNIFDKVNLDFKVSVDAPHLQIPCPTHQMAMKWLREVHNIFIEISVSIDLNGNYHYSYFVLDKECKYVRKGYTDFDWDYEQTVEAALKYCLENLI